jgi:hypothetical protein
MLFTSKYKNNNFPIYEKVQSSHSMRSSQEEGASRGHSRLHSRLSYVLRISSSTCNGLLTFMNCVSHILRDVNVMILPSICCILLLARSRLLSDQVLVRLSLRPFPQSFSTMLIRDDNCNKPSTNSECRENTIVGLHLRRLSLTTSINRPFHPLQVESFPP